MCGICGYIDYKNSIDEGVIYKMVDSIRHRGPNDRGVSFYTTRKALIALGHTRLSILDLSQAGHQPMEYANLSVVFNGEIYNFKEVRLKLQEKGHCFISNTDTEVILHAFHEWKFSCVDHFIGMFAFAIFDKTNESLYLCRDRAGVKPLYYYIGNGIFAFASELKSLMVIPIFKRHINQEALSTFLKLGYIPGNMCIFDCTYKINAGEWLEYKVPSCDIGKIKYWDIESFFQKPKLNISYEDAKSELKQLFKSAFGYRLVSDVPIGVLLSGGIDSSTVVSILVKELGIIPNTFTIGFKNFVDETSDAEQISGLLGTKHVSNYCDLNDVKDLIPKLPLIYDEPFADTSALPTILISQIVKKYVSVVLSADGGDEVFAGYPRYDRMEQFYKRISNIPSTFRCLIPCHLLEKVMPQRFTKAHMLIEQLQYIYRNKVITTKAWYDNMWNFNQGVINTVAPTLSKYDYRDIFQPFKDSIDSSDYMLMADWKTQMKDEYLVKVDRAMMSVSLEGREPMLDHRIAEFVAQLPWSYKYKKNEQKRILRDIVYDYLPSTLLNKPKRGFAPPIMDWMRNDLKDYVFESLSSDKLKSTGFDYDKILKILNYFMNGDNHYYNLIWRIVQYQEWINCWCRNNNF